MTGGLPALSQSRFPNDKPPTIFSPASPKDMTSNAQKVEKDTDADSLASQTTFSSTISLIKVAAGKRNWTQLYKEYRENRKEETSPSPVMKEKKASKRKPLPKDPVSPMQRTAEAYMYIAHR